MRGSSARLPVAAVLEEVRERPSRHNQRCDAIVSVDPGLLDETVERVNITLPRRVLKRLDALARAAGESRSGYIAQLTLEEPRRVE